jgi:hypothetical protein
MKPSLQNRISALVYKAKEDAIDALIARGAKTPYFHLSGYMERFWIFNPYVSDGNGGYIKKWKWLPSARLHHILASDTDKAFHDHPWPYLTIILRGGYFEVTPVFDKAGFYTGDKTVWRGPGSVLFRKANTFHRLVVPTGETAWTLFTTGKFVQKWGFLIHPQRKQYYRDFLDAQENSEGE